MALTNTDVTVTSTWAELSAAATGDFILQNESQASARFAQIGSGGSENIRWAFSPTGVAPTERGFILFPGDSMARGTIDGFVWAKTDSDTGTVAAQVAE